jgi:hypothetical protein
MVTARQYHNMDKVIIVYRLVMSGAVSTAIAQVDG